MIQVATQPEDAPGRVPNSEWKAIVARYQRPSTARAVWQVINSHGSYLLVAALTYWAWSYAWWLALPLAVLGGGLLVRVFIVLHDCGHGSFFRSERGNDLVGGISGLLTLTPYHDWRSEHATHHATSGDLDRRGTGDMWTMTVEEYLMASRWKRFAYRLARNPLILFVLAPLFVFLILERFPRANSGARERRSVYLTNVGLVALAALMIWSFGWLPVLVIQGTSMAVAGSAGVWLFYVQHQFEGTYWARRSDWDYATAALKGSSFYNLPRVLQWFSGNIGFHHIHHLSPRIPNYHLEACHRANPLFHEVTHLTLFGSLRSLQLRLWDESSQRLIGYRHLRRARARARRSHSVAAER